MIVFISGTGTDVGKSFVNMRLNTLLMERGYNIISIKPIETGVGNLCESSLKGFEKVEAIYESSLDGYFTSLVNPADCHDFALQNLAMTEKKSAKSCDDGGTDSHNLDSLCDATLHAQNQSIPKDISEICFYRFTLPAAPFVADSQSIIDIDFLKNKITSLEKQCDILLVEGAGGLFVPIKRDYFFIDLIKDLGDFQSKTLCVLVSSDKLGCIDAILSHREALERRNITFISIVNLFDKAQFMCVSYPFLRHLERNFILQTQEREILDFIARFIES